MPAARLARRVVLRPLRAVARAYREVWRDIVHLWTTGQLRARELDWHPLVRTAKPPGDRLRGGFSGV